VIGNSICEVSLDDGSVEIVAEQNDRLVCLPFAVVYSPDGNEIAFGGAVEDGAATFNQIFMTESKHSK